MEWAPGWIVATRLELTPETWTTSVELIDTAGGGTRVTMTATPTPRAMVRRTVESELDEIPAHPADLRS